MEPTTNSQLKPIESPSLKNIFRKYSSYWMWFILSLILSIIITFLYLRYTVPQYQVNATILIKDDKKGADLSQASEVFKDLDIFNSTSNLDNEIEVLKGRNLMLRVLKKLNLQTSFFKKGKIKTSEVYGNSIPFQVENLLTDSSAYDQEIEIEILDQTKFTYRDNDSFTTYSFNQPINKKYATFSLRLNHNNFIKGEEIILKINDLRKMAIKYSDMLTVSPTNKNASVVKLSINTNLPQKGIDLINTLISTYNEEAVEDKNTIALNTIKFIDERLRFLVKELSVVEKDVEVFKRKNNVTDVVSESQSYLQNSSEYEKKLSDFELQNSVLNLIEKYLNNPNNKFGIVPSSLSISDPTLQSLINSFNTLQLNYRRVANDTEAENPITLNLAEQLNTLRSSILENIKNIKRSLFISKQNISGNANKFQNQKNSVPYIERELLEIKRQQSIKEALYLYLLNKREESQLSLAATVSNSRIIDAADMEDEPVKPKKSMVYFIAFIAALGLPIFAISIKSAFDDKVKNIADIKYKTTTPILGEICNSQIFEKLVIKKDSRTTIAELFRLIRSNLSFFANDTEKKVILVTSSMSGEGKTFFSINLGATLALAGNKVLLLEFDIRNPKLLKDLEIESKAGITNLIIGETNNPSELIKPVDQIENLYVLGAGPLPPNPSELLLNARISEIFEYAKAHYDYIIVDSSPIGLVSDSFSLSKFVDQTVYMVRCNFTQKEQLNIIKDIYDNHKLTNPMIVLNDAQNDVSRNYYNYGYGYGYGQNQASNKLNRLKKIFKF